jgi:hypothetical protein
VNFPSADSGKQGLVSEAWLLVEQALQRPAQECPIAARGVDERSCAAWPPYVIQ